MVLHSNNYTQGATPHPAILGRPPGPLSLSPGCLPGVIPVCLLHPPPGAHGCRTREVEGHGGRGQTHNGGHSLHNNLLSPFHKHKY